MSINWTKIEIIIIKAVLIVTVKNGWMVVYKKIWQQCIYSSPSTKLRKINVEMNGWYMNIFNTQFVNFLIFIFSRCSVLSCSFFFVVDIFLCLPCSFSLTQFSKWVFYRKIAFHKSIILCTYTFIYHKIFFWCTQCTFQPQPNHVKFCVFAFLEK